MIFCYDVKKFSAEFFWRQNAFLKVGLKYEPEQIIYGIHCIFNGFLQCESENGWLNWIFEQMTFHIHCICEVSLPCESENDRLNYIFEQMIFHIHYIFKVFFRCESYNDELNYFFEQMIFRTHPFSDSHRWKTLQMQWVRKIICSKE